VNGRFQKKRLICCWPSFSFQKDTVTVGWVHGDLRSPNILVQGEQVFLIDLDWAGKPNDQQPPKYPPLLNSEVFDEECQERGIKAGEPITKEHDLFMLARLRPKDLAQ